MAQELTFAFKIEPIAKERARQGRNPATGAPMWFTPKKTRVFEARLRDEARYQMRKSGLQGFAQHVPLMISIRFTFAIKDQKRWGLYKCTKPDIDNLEKSICDTLNEIAYFDDGQIVVMSSVKGYGPEDRVDILIKPVLEDGFAPLPLMVAAR